MIGVAIYNNQPIMNSHSEFTGFDYEAIFFGYWK